MGYRNHGKTAFTIGSRQQPVNVGLVFGIQKGRGFVKKENFRSLRKRCGDEDFLALAAAEGAEKSFGEFRYSRNGQRIVNRIFIFLAW